MLQAPCKSTAPVFLVNLADVEAVCARIDYSFNAVVIDLLAMAMRAVRSPRFLLDRCGWCDLRRVQGLRGYLFCIPCDGWACRDRRQGVDSKVFRLVRATRRAFCKATSCQGSIPWFVARIAWAGSQPLLRGSCQVNVHVPEGKDFPRARA